MDIKEFENARGNELILITSDKRLETAAKAEGLHVINPEAMPLSEIAKLLTPPESARP